MRTLLVVGIGSGDPEQVTVQAINALNRVDVVLFLDKAAEQHQLADVRTEILDRYVTRSYRTAHREDPPRDRRSDAYVDAVHDWRRRRADRFAEMLRDDVAAGETAAFLVWGDTSLYDSTLAIVEDITARGLVEFSYEVIPGISCVSALAARHKTVLNQVARPVQITTGRLLAQGWPTDVDDVVVMLDAHTSFTEHLDQDAWIYWGGYLGTPEEILISGPLADVAGEIEAVRAEARAKHGWIMDTYLLRRASPSSGAESASQ